MAVNLNAISEIPCQEVTWISKGAIFYDSENLQASDIMLSHGCHWNVLRVAHSRPSHTSCLASKSERHYRLGSSLSGTDSRVDSKYSNCSVYIGNALTSLGTHSLPVFTIQVESAT